MAMLGRKPFNPNAYVPPVNVGSEPLSAAVSPIGLPDVPTFTKPEPKHNWVGILADALAGLAGQGPVYAPIAERRRQEQTAFERGEEQYSRRRKDAETDDARNYQQQLGLIDYKRLHPDDALTQSMISAGIDPNSDAGRQYYRANVERLTAPPMMSSPGFDEQGNPVLRFFPRAPATPKVIPTLPPGVVPLGGPTPPASGGFPWFDH